MKKDGKLIYSTCTVNKEENELVIKRFLNENQRFIVDPLFSEELPIGLRNSQGLTEFGIQLFPQDLNSDGFFYYKTYKER